MTTVTLCAVFAMMLALGQAVAARHRAGGAADLASLAAADRAPRGEAEACGAAREVAGAQGAELIRCAVQGEIADVTARVRFGPYAPEVRSRAGPPAAEESGTPETAPTRDGASVPTRDGAPVAPGAAAATPGAQIRAALNGGSASSGGVQEPRVRP
ncbi:Rv3654c family TadE-like protein [Streptomyces clavifer]|uniref:Rv3654c family TadE-like protein n=1 Tax=Streptomyces clavifer TaxID=68188 RepID=UPI003817FE3C